MLPQFASFGYELYDTPEAQHTMCALMDRGLGWHVTDWGSGDYTKQGTVLLTLRNGSLDERDQGSGQTYAEKLIYLRDGQGIPYHFHKRKTEDIINRSGGTLNLEVSVKADDSSLGSGEVELLQAGVTRTVGSGEPLSLKPGESVQIPTLVYHRLWAAENYVVVGEVSSVNDDATDNYFLEDGSSYAGIADDATPRYRLVNEYPCCG